MCIRWLVERTARPHSTLLRAGSPLRFAPVGMTIHIWVRHASAQENFHPNESHNSPNEQRIPPAGFPLEWHGRLRSAVSHISPKTGEIWGTPDWLLERAKRSMFISPLTCHRQVGCSG